MAWRRQRMCHGIGEFLTHIFQKFNQSVPNMADEAVLAFFKEFSPVLTLGWHKRGGESVLKGIRTFPL